MKKILLGLSFSLTLYFRKNYLKKLVEAHKKNYLFIKNLLSLLFNIFNEKKKLLRKCFNFFLEAFMKPLLLFQNYCENVHYNENKMSQISLSS